MVDLVLYLIRAVWFASPRRFLDGHVLAGCYNHRGPVAAESDSCSPHFLQSLEICAMKARPTSPNTSDADAAVRIALVREMTEAARNGAIGWSVRDRRLRAVFSIAENSRAFDSSRPC